MVAPFCRSALFTGDPGYEVHCRWPEGIAKVNGAGWVKGRGWGFGEREG